MSTSGIELEQVDPDLVDTMRQVLGSGQRTSDLMGEGVALDRQLWGSLEELGLARLTGDESTGGSGAGWIESAALLGEAARAAIPLPLAEHDLLGGWLLEQAGMKADARIRTVAVVDGAGAATAVPWAGEAESIVTAVPQGDGWLVAGLAPEAFEITAGRNIAGESRDRLVLRAPIGEDAVRVSAGVIEELRFRGALARAVQTTAALEAALGLAIDHASTRIQFGRTLAKFQSIQNLLADASAATSLARAATDAAVHRAAAGGDLAWSVAVARSCAGQAASVVVRGTHQVLGAIGTTAEHDLHRFTLPALAWRSEFGTNDSWNLAVARLAEGAGPGGLWRLITDAS